MNLVPISEQRRDTRWGALAVIVAAQFMVILDVAIVNVALPAIKSDLHFSEENLQWVITAYAILFGGLLLLGGRLADVLGRRRVFIAGVGLFSVTSLLCGLAWSEQSLIVFRAVQGAGGAVLAPAALAMLMTTFREGRDRNVALGIWGAASGSGGAAGVLLGGVLTSYLHWSWIFFINVPVGAAVIAVTPLLLRESRADRAHRHFDVAGALSVTGAVMLLVYAMTRATQHGWGTGTTIALLGASAALGLAFVAVELRSRSPLLPMRMFRVGSIAAANLTTVAVAAVAFSMFFLLTLYLQQVLGYSAVQTGVAFVAITLTIVIVSNVAQTLVTRFGPRWILATGLTVAAAALAYLSQLPVHGHYASDVLPALLLGGVGMALSFISMTIAGLSGVGGADAGVASGLINTSRQVGGAIGLAAVSTISTTAASHYARSHAGTKLLEASAQTHGFEIAFYVLTGVALVGALVAAIFIAPQRPAEALPRVDVPEPIEEAA
jgi:EmrB/QacA subfamily drug resistance transporter